MPSFEVQRKVWALRLFGVSKGLGDLGCRRTGSPAPVFFERGNSEASPKTRYQFPNLQILSTSKLPTSKFKS